MRKRIWLALLPITLLWCGCSEDDHDHTREITAVASTSDVTVSQSTRAPITAFDQDHPARVLAKNKEDYSTLWCNGTMTFTGTDAVRYGDITDGSDKNFPEGEDKVYLCGLYPATDWSGVGSTSTSGTVTHALDGKTDIMWAVSKEATPDNPAALNFNHLLTRLNIKLKKDRTYDVIVKDIKLIKTAGDKLYTECNVNLDAESVTDAVSFSSGDGSTKELPCFPTGSDGSFPTDGIDVPSINETDAYILAPSLTADEVSTNEYDYTLSVEYSIGETKQPLKDVIKLNLENDIGTGGGDYTDATMGCTFEIEICFTLKNVRATATIDPWADSDPVNNPDVFAQLDPYIPELTPGGSEPGTADWDGMTNCFMVKPGDKLVFPVKRAYKYKGNNEWFNVLRTATTDTEYYTGGFEVNVLWDLGSGVIKGEPKVYGKGQNAVVELETTIGTLGNAVVALKRTDTQKIVWSYHIWVTNYVPTPTSNTFHVYNPRYDYQFFNVNLGDEDGTPADNLQKTGLIYQWGRKDPFMTKQIGDEPLHESFKMTKYEGGSLTMKDLTENPTTYVWADNTSYLSICDIASDNAPWLTDTETKSITDPCPIGSRVVDIGEPSGSNDTYTTVTMSWWGTHWGAKIPGFETHITFFIDEKGVRVDYTQGGSPRPTMRMWAIPLFRKETNKRACWTIPNGDVDRIMLSTSAITGIQGYPVRCAYHTKKSS